jgi:membrane protein DedA with SNARE-associated domain
MASPGRRTAPAAGGFVTDLSLLDRALAFIAAHDEWATLIVALFVLGESIAFLSILLPATAVLLAVGAMVGAGAIPFWDLLFACVAACLLGDAISFAAGRWLGPRARTVWPFTRHPRLLDQGERFFREMGAAGVLVARFFGPLRAVAPLVAGALGMPPLRFAAVSAVSAPLFILTMIGPGALVAYGLASEGGGAARAIGVAIPVVVIACAAFMAMRAFKRAHRIEEAEGLDP